MSSINRILSGVYEEEVCKSQSFSLQDLAVAIEEAQEIFANSDEVQEGVEKIRATLDDSDLDELLKILIESENVTDEGWIELLNWAKYTT